MEQQENSAPQTQSSPKQQVQPPKTPPGSAPKVVEKVVERPITTDPLWAAYVEVATGKVDINVGIAGYREYVHNLPPDEFDQWRAGARVTAERIRMLAEAFSQAIVVLAAGQ